MYAGINGVGLALVIPCCQSMIANSYPAEKRGIAFGLMQTTGYVGVLVGGLFATNVGHMTPFGMDGWRFALHCVALMSILTGQSMVQSSARLLFGYLQIQLIQHGYGKLLLWLNQEANLRFHAESMQMLFSGLVVCDWDV